jgi:hypothetical protein
MTGRAAIGREQLFALDRIALKVGSINHARG